MFESIDLVPETDRRPFGPPGLLIIDRLAEHEGDVELGIQEAFVIEAVVLLEHGEIQGCF